MDDRRAQFLIIVGEVCGDARLAGLAVEVVMDDHRHVHGVPGALVPPGTGQLDDTGLPTELVVGDEAVPLASVTEIRVRAPRE
jgi:hypothetical protein